MELNEDYNIYRNMLNKALDSVDQNQLIRMKNEIYDCALNKSKLFVCGNGGSAAISEHLSCDHVKGVRSDTHLKTEVYCLTSNVSLITAIGNDIGYDYVFSKQIEWYQSWGSKLLVISSSGNSPNILEAIIEAKKHGMKTMALVGFDGGKAKQMVDIAVHVNCNNYGVVEDSHQIIMHILAQHFRKMYALRPNSLKL